MSNYICPICNNKLLCSYFECIESEYKCSDCSYYQLISNYNNNVNYYEFKIHNIICRFDLEENIVVIYDCLTYESIELPLFKIDLKSIDLYKQILYKIQITMMLT
jgi:hypothetical protein